MNARRWLLAALAAVLAVLAGPHLAGVVMASAPPAGICVMTVALALRCRRLAREGCLRWG